MPQWELDHRTRNKVRLIIVFPSMPDGYFLRFVLADTEKLHLKISVMSDRIRRLEDALAVAQASISKDEHPLLGRELLNIKSSLELHSAAEERERDLSGKGEERDEDAHCIDAFGTLAIRDDGAATFYGRSAGSEVSTLLVSYVQALTSCFKVPPYREPSTLKSSYSHM